MACGVGVGSIAVAGEVMHLVWDASLFRLGRVTCMPKMSGQLRGIAALARGRPSHCCPVMVRIVLRK